MTSTETPTTSSTDATISTEGQAGDVGELYDQLEHDVLHFGFWRDDADTSSFEQASEQLTDLVLERLELTGQERILDVGCGSGTPALRLAGTTTTTSLVGVTISAQQVERATRRAEQAGLGDRLEFQLADAMALPFPDDSFDVAFALESVQHMDRITVLQELARVVRPGGRIVLTDLFRRAPAPLDGPSVLDALVPMWMMTPPCALADYPGLLRDAGLRQVEVNDITDNVVRRSFTEALALITKALEAGTADALPNRGDLDLSVPAHQQAVIQFAELMTRTAEVGYLLLVATVPEPAADN